MEPQEDDVTEPKTRHSNRTAGPGSACRLRSDCANFLICLTSARCGCPEPFPVLTRREGSFACTAPRRLNERCLSNAECSHGNEHARCLHSLCRCPPHFYATRASLLCLPESVAWRPVQAAVLPAALLLPVPAAVFLFTALGYYRSLHSHSYRKRERTPSDFRSHDDSSDLRYERFRKFFEGRSGRKISRASTTFCFSSDRWYIGAPCAGFGRDTVVPGMVQDCTVISNSNCESDGFAFEVGRTRRFSRRVKLIQTGERNQGTSIVSSHAGSTRPGSYTRTSPPNSTGPQECTNFAVTKLASDSADVLSKLHRNIQEDKAGQVQLKQLHFTETELRCRPCRKCKSQEMRIRSPERL
ncbi:hypothetical protein V5799_017604 [Amblyomma americanum]|uniref:EB domain-containing protein n=1 Tax=Amblyomma americanum TaxID=6943 RepID=A0AAQ4F1N2_AMBAM